MSDAGLVSQMNMENARLYSNYAWIFFLRDKTKLSKTTIEKSSHFFDISPISPDADFFIRFGLIKYYTGSSAEGWDAILKALLIDSRIESKSDMYLSHLADIIPVMTDLDPGTIDTFITNYRRENAPPLPSINIHSEIDSSILLASCPEEILFVVFFSPTCGSCRMEIPKLSKINLLADEKETFRVVFILNRPDLFKQAVDFLNDSGFETKNMYKLSAGNAYDFIEAEPCTWIIDESRKIRFKHVGFELGDEIIYMTEIQELLNEDSSISQSIEK
jgi:thiol-disulfide isomerase/thioredoxin